MLTLISLQLLLTGIAAYGAWLAWHADLGILWTLGVGFGGLLLCQAILTPIFITKASKPLKIISQAIAHVSKDPIQTPPPNLSHKKYERSGLRSMVQTIYELAAKPAPLPTTLALDTITTRYHVLFDNAPTGIMALNSAGEIVMANSLAPVHKNSDGKLVMELDFGAENSLTTWLKNAQTSKVHDTTMWPRVANRLPGEQDRRIFDVIASYNKGAPGSLETILMTIDRTGQYVPFDEDMDFIALAAHELRGPITVIRGYLDIAADELHTKLDPDQQELIDRLQVSAEQLSGYINNILNVSRYDRNHLQLHLREEKLSNILKEL
ncbi:MAG TPA: histidine kinase dimerization/phospho-acceptor domain-containing protein, partial [Candidatus Acidoferrum sp.]|nr:histidine kinase dimerization/phospho-acceptor domain-containing protein [Candidatus Acidoferrum sp.]